MNRNLLNIVLASLVLALSLSLDTTAFGQATLKGTVVDKAGAPVDDAKVWIQTAAPKVGKGYL